MKFKTLAVVTFGPGAVLGLSEDQARARKYLTTPVAGRKGWYELTGTTQFKRGEEFGYEGELPKAMAEALALPGGGSVAEHARKPKARASAAADGK